MTQHPIYSVIELLKKARQAEADCAVSLADARAAVERHKAIALATAYQSGRIDGKNAETRKVQEGDVLADAPAVREAEVLVRQIETKHTAARIEREYQADRYQAMLALMPRVEYVFGPTQATAAPPTSVVNATGGQY